MADTPPSPNPPATDALLPPEPPLEPGAELGRFRVVGLLGEGAVARVYRVRHRVLGTDHAIKLLRTADPSLRSRLLQEARVQARIRHAHVVVVTDVLEHEGLPAIVMEWVPGPSLDRHLAEHGPLPFPLARRLFLQMQSALEAAHAAGVLHRDLKPGNVLLWGEGDSLSVKLTDFGLARIPSAPLRDGQTRQGMAMGTPGYMAPEQWADAHSVDARADIFGLGALFYEALAGHPPFTGKSMFAVMKRTLAGKHPPLLQARPDCPPALAAMIERALEPVPEDRFPDVAAFRQALEAAIIEPASPLEGSPSPEAPQKETPAAETAAVEPTGQAYTLTIPSIPTPAPPASPPARQPSRTGQTIGLLLVASGLLSAGLAAALLFLFWVYESRPEALPAEPVTPLPAPPPPPLPPVVHIPEGPFPYGESGKMVNVPAFLIDRWELSISRYAACHAAGACSALRGTIPTAADSPAAGLSWDQAYTVCVWAGGRLPTEAEWEKAATTGPTDTTKALWPWGALPPDCKHAQFAGCSPEGPVGVQSLPDSASGWGIEQMAGNVWEWTVNRTERGKKGTWFRKATPSRYAMRGGGWSSEPGLLRPTARRSADHDERQASFGVRCAYSPTGPSDAGSTP